LIAVSGLLFILEIVVKSINDIDLNLDGLALASKSTNPVLAQSWTLLKKEGAI